MKVKWKEEKEWRVKVSRGEGWRGNKNRESEWNSI